MSAEIKYAICNNTLRFISIMVVCILVDGKDLIGFTVFCFENVVKRECYLLKLKFHLWLANM